MQSTIARVVAMTALLLSVNAQAAQPGSEQTSAAWYLGGFPTPLAKQTAVLIKNAGQDGLNPDNYISTVLMRGVEVGAVSPQEEKVLANAFKTATTNYLRDLRYGVNENARGGVSVKDADKDVATSELLARAEAAQSLTAVVNAARPNLAMYKHLALALPVYRSLIDNPAWKTQLPLPTSKSVKAVDYSGYDRLIKRLQLLGDLPDKSQLSPAEVSGGIKEFQARHAVGATGAVDKATIDALNVSPEHRTAQILLAMDRLRSIPHASDSRLILVNIPQFKLLAYQPGKSDREPVLAINVIVGKAGRTETPQFAEELKLVEFNPYWNIPPSIQAEEIVPKLKKNPAWFKHEGFEFVAPDGNVISNMSRENLAAAADGYLRIRQKPGKQNPLGNIKFVFPNHDNIYLHYTSSEHLFKNPRRDFSHGCVRVEEPEALAKFVLGGEEGWSDKRIIEAMDNGESTGVRVKKPFPVVLTYLTATTNKAGKVMFYPDIYQLDAAEWRKLKGKLQ